MAKMRKKLYIEQNVYEAALDRLRYIYSQFDKVTVSFSGGKDSTALLDVTITVAKELNRLPVEVVFYDEEAIPHDTIDYVKRVSDRKEVDLKWYCIEYKHRNACSSTEPWWYCWDKSKKDLWVREMPTGVNLITNHVAFKKGMNMQEFSQSAFVSDNVGINAVMLIGIRTEESMRRYRVVCAKKNENYIARAISINDYNRAYPIYDWSSKDVWKLVLSKGIDYNKTYDVYNATKIYDKHLTQRVCPPFGEQPLQGLWKYKECYPKMWDKMINRVKGAHTASMYAKTSLYGQTDKPEEYKTYKEYTQAILSQYLPKEKADISEVINRGIYEHYSKTDDPVPEEMPHPLTGFSWKFLSMIAKKVDYKGRYVRGAMNNAARTNGGLSKKEAAEKYGNKRFKQRLKNETK